MARGTAQVVREPACEDDLMNGKPNGNTQYKWRPIQPRKMGNPVSKVTQVAGKRIGGALRAEQARQQKRRDTRR
jgi:hypothetical protein